MSLTVVAGLPGSRVFDHARERLSGAVHAGKSALLVLPAGPDVVRARGALAAAIPVGLRIATLDGALEAEWALRGDGRRFVGAFQRDVVAARALASSGVSPTPGRGAVALLQSLAVRKASVPDSIRGAASGLSDVLIRALDTYEESLRALGLVEPAEAACALASGPAPAEVVWAAGFAMLPQAHELLLRGWGSDADVSVVVPWSPSAAGASPLEPLVHRFLSGGATIVDLGGPADGRPGELARIGSHLFAAPDPRPGEGAVRLGVAHGDDAEARMITGLVRAAIDTGSAPGSIAVVFADPERHVGWLRRAFDDEGVAAEWDVRVAIRETPFGRALLHLWRFWSDGLRREDLGAFLRSPFSGLKGGAADRADFTWRRSGITEGRRLIRCAGEAAPFVLDAGDAAARPIDAEIAKKWKKMVDRALANAHPGAAPIPDGDGAVDAAAHRLFCRYLTEAVELGECAVTAGELWRAFAESRVASGSASGPDRVVVTSLERVARGSFEHVVLGGLTASELPRQGGGDAVEGDAVKRALAALGIEIDPEERTAAERLAFYLAASSPSASLALVRRASDDEGRALRESVFWDEFLDLYRMPGSDLPAEGRPTIERLPSGDADRCHGVTAPRRGVLIDGGVLETMAAIEAVSPGEIESYTACPYRWFVERKLRPSAPDVQLDVMAVGRAVHEALALFYRRWHEVAPRVSPELLPQALSVASIAVAEVLADAPVPDGLDQQQLLRTVSPQVLALVERDARFLPDYSPKWVEWSFGLDQGDDAVDLGGLLVKGRADRIDVGPQGLVVIDYKRSHASTLADIGRNGLVQLQLYAAAASARLSVPIAGGLYRSLAGGEDRGFILEGVTGEFKANDVVDRDGIDGVIASALEVAREAVDGMRAGRIAPAPLRERCRYCAASSFCSEAVRS
jgi:RecB family exonuclease